MLYPAWVGSFYRIVRFGFGAALIALLAMWAVSTLSWPFSRDQGILAWAGSVVRAGGVPYRDAWDVKGPIALVPFAATQFLFGRNMWGIRVFDLLIGVANLTALAIAAHRFWDRITAEYAVILGALFATWLNFAISAQPDEWCGCALTVIVAILSSTKQAITQRSVAACSFLVGLCVLQKPVYAVFILLLVPFIDRRSRAIRKSIIAALLGFSLPIVATLIYFGFHRAVGSLIDTYLLFNLRAHVKVEGSPAEQVRYFLYAWQAFLPLAAGVPLAIFGAVVLTTRSSRLGALYLLWFSLNVFIIIVQGKYFEYQFVPLVAPVALGGGLALRQLRDFRPAAATVVLMTFILLFINDPLRSVKEWISYRSGKISRNQYDAHFVYLNKNHYDSGTIRLLATYVREHSTNTDTIQVWGFDAGINYLADRAAPSRFGYTYPLEIGSKNPYLQGYRAEFLDKIHEKPPVYVLVPSQDAFGSMPASDQSFNEFTGFHDFVLARYNVEKTIENWTLYRLR